MTEEELTRAERALGTLPGGDGGEWDRRLAPLLDTVPEAEPPAGAFDRALAAISEGGGGAELVVLRRAVRRWRAAAAVAVAAAAALLLAVLIPLATPPSQTRYVALVTNDADGSPGMLVQVDPVSGVATVVPLGIEPPEDRTFQMWQLPVGAERPSSIGLLPAGPDARRDVAAAPGDLFAISIEQPGGSPTGQPTDARYHGELIAID